MEIMHDDGETEEQYLFKVRIIRNYRKAVRREFFRRKAILAKLAELSSRPGVVTAGDRCGAGSERSAAGPGQCNDGGQSHPPITGAELNLSHKTMPERDDENMGQTDYLPSSSGCIRLSMGIPTIDQAIQPGQEQKPALTDRKDE